MRSIYIIILLLIALFCVLSCTKGAVTHHIVFENKPCIRPLAAHQYITCDYFKINIDADTIIIKPGFRTDLASIPRPLWSFMSPMKASLVYPAILHDFMYSGVYPVSRKEADTIFYEALLYEGASGFTANKIWLAVRLFGHNSYKNRLLTE